MVGKLLSFWEGLFSGAMLVDRRVYEMSGIVFKYEIIKKKDHH